MGPPALGCVGTAKNTGKTTALTAILEEARARGYRVALTSIGYDGEELDNVTRLPKPRVPVRPGDLVASARPCLERSPVEWEPVADCGFSTALGSLVLARITSPGRVILAGPAYRRGLQRLLDILRRTGEPDLLLVDGAFARLSPLARAAGLVVSTGAARCTDPEAVAREAGAIVRLFSLPRGPLRGRIIRHLQSEQDCREAARHLEAGLRLVVPGMVTLSALRHLAGMLAPEVAGARGNIVFTSPVQLLLAGEPARVVEVLEELVGLGTGLALGAGPAILAVTVNPFYPRPVGPGRFVPAFVDAEELRDRVAAAAGAGVPVVDVFRQGAERLWRAVEAGLLGARREAEPVPGPERVRREAQG